VNEEGNDSQTAAVATSASADARDAIRLPPFHALVPIRAGTLDQQQVEPPWQPA
jgi:hypothetical protein